MRKRVLCCLALMVSSSSLLAQLSISPTTTLTAQTTNNTSAAATFVSQSNGNLGGAAISKEDIHSLLYAGAATKVYAHLVTWFGGSSHMNVGYSSNDPAQVHRQIEDMVSRGIDGVIIDWYGPNNAVDDATKLVMAEAEAHAGFTFFIMVDKGAIKWDSCSGCTPQQALIAQLQYIAQTYYPSPAYARQNGRPLVTNFDLDLNFTIDWSAVAAAAPGSPLFIFQNASGFTHAYSGGSYSWVMPTTTDFGMSYLGNFYSAGMSVPAEFTFGGVYKGFNDTLASWGSNRIMGQQCGQTWLSTFAKINGLYNAGNPLSSLQLVTWNDYEEGTEIESGIDNCVSVTASTSGNSLNWSIGGNSNTVARQVVYISSDGQNLMPLAQLTPDVRSLDLCGFSPANGVYSLFVQAVGQPTLTNKMSSAVSFNAQCGTTSGTGTGTSSPPATLNVALSPTALDVSMGQSVSSRVQVTAQPLPYNSPVSFACSGLPAGAICQFAPSSVVPGSSSASTTVTVSTSNMTAGLRPRSPWRLPAAWSLGLGMAGMVMVGGGSRRRRHLALLLASLLVLGFVSCGGAGTPAAQQRQTATSASRTYTIVITATSGAIQASTTASLTVR